MNAPVGWGPVRTGMILIGIGMLVIGGAHLVQEVLVTGEIAKLRKSAESGEKIFDRVELYQKVFELFTIGGLMLLLIGAVGVMRAPRPSSAFLLALIALLACVAGLLVEGSIFVMRVSEAKFLDKLWDIRAIWVVDTVITAGMLITLTLAVHMAMRGAGQRGALALVIIACVLVGLFMLWLCYYVAARPRWDMPIHKPWLWFALTDLPRVARDVMVGVVALVGAAQMRQARA